MELLGSAAMWRGVCAVLVVGSSVLLGGPAEALTLINNGLDPTNPANAIPGTNSYDYDGGVLVRNVGCTGTGDCASPGAPTGVAIEGPGLSSTSLDGSVSVYDTSSVSMSGGEALSLKGYGSSSIVMSGGSLGAGVEAHNDSRIELSGNANMGDMHIYDDAVVRMRDSAFGGAGIFTYGSSFLSINSPGAAHLNSFESSVVVIDGGMTDAIVSASGSSLIEFIGSDFMVDGVPVGYGDLGAVSGTLSGTLASGDILTDFLMFSRLDDGIIRLTATPVPEPSAALAFGLGAFVVGSVTRRKVS